MTNKKNKLLLRKRERVFFQDFDLSVRDGDNVIMKVKGKDLTEFGEVLEMLNLKLGKKFGLKKK